MLLRRLSFMSTFSKNQHHATNKAVQAEIGCRLRVGYDELVSEPMPTCFTDLLMRIESKERVARLDAGVERLRARAKGPPHH